MNKKLKADLADGVSSWSIYLRELHKRENSQADSRHINPMVMSIVGIDRHKGSFFYKLLDEMPLLAVTTAFFTGLKDTFQQDSTSDPLHSCLGGRVLNAANIQMQPYQTMHINLSVLFLCSMTI